MRFVRMVSSGVCGSNSSRISWQWRSNSAGSSPGISGFCAVRPCFVAFWAVIALPVAVFGPVEFCAFLRFASICFCVDIGFPLHFELELLFVFYIIYIMDGCVSSGIVGFIEKCGTALDGGGGIGLL